MIDFHIYSDGACSPNPGVGGYGYVVINLRFYTNIISKRFGGLSDTTNNVMEMMGVIRGLEELPIGSSVIVYSDSRYVINCATLKWQIKKNEKLWGRMFQAIRKHRNVEFVHVKGHNGNKYNEMADKLAVKGRVNIKNREELIHDSKT